MTVAVNRESAIARGARVGIVDLHIVRHFLRPQSDGMNWDAPIAKRGNGIQVDAARIVVSVGQQHHGANRQIRSLGRKLLETFADVSGWRGRLQLFQAGDASDVAIDAIQSRLKLLLQLREYAALQDIHASVRAAWRRRCDGHAARVVHEQRDDVLLRLQLRDSNRRLPQ